MARSLAVAASAGVFLLCTVGVAQTYRLTDLGAFPGATYCIAYAINDAGDVVGACDRPGIGSRAFLWRNGVMTDLGTLGGAMSAATGINDHGQVAGWAQNAAGQHRVVVFDLASGVIRDVGAIGSRIVTVSINNQDFIAGTFRPHTYGGATGAFYSLPGQAPQNMGTMGGLNAGAYGVNDDGIVAGWSGATQGISAFTWQNGAFSSTGFPAGTVLSQAYGINSAGHLAVTVMHADYTYHAYFYDGAWLDCGAAPGGTGAPESNAYAISDSDQVVGSVSSTSGDHAFVWSARTGMLDLNGAITPGGGWTLREARAISRRGQIVGDGLRSGQSHGFLLTPVPVVVGTTAID